LPVTYRIHDEATSMNDKARLRQLIDEVIAARREYWRLAFDRQPEIQLGNPATPQQLARLERKFSSPLPPSYRAFLELHNGWSGFDGDLKLLSTEDHDTAWVKDWVNHLGSLIREAGGENPFEHGALPILLGRDEQAFAFLEPRTVRKNGEMDVVSYELINEEDRFKDFVAFVKDNLEMTKELIKEELEGVEDDIDDEG
jgi:hypothetical protein